MDNRACNTPTIRDTTRRKRRRRRLTTPSLCLSGYTIFSGCFRYVYLCFVSIITYNTPFSLIVCLFFFWLATASVSLSSLVRVSSMYYTVYIYMLFINKCIVYSIYMCVQEGTMETKNDEPGIRNSVKMSSHGNMSFAAAYLVQCLYIKATKAKPKQYNVTFPINSASRISEQALETAEKFPFRVLSNYLFLSISVT